MGTMEILVVLLLAFILLGPQRMLDAARLLGKATRELRRMSEGLADLSLDEERPESRETTAARPGGHADRAGTQATVPSDKGATIDAGPVGFQPSGTAEESAEGRATPPNGRAGQAEQ